MHIISDSYVLMDAGSNPKDVLQMAVDLSSSYQEFDARKAVACIRREYLALSFKGGKGVPFDRRVQVAIPQLKKGTMKPHKWRPFDNKEGLLHALNTVTYRGEQNVYKRSVCLSFSAPNTSRQILSPQKGASASPRLTAPRTFTNEQRQALVLAEQDMECR